MLFSAMPWWCRVSLLTWLGLQYATRTGWARMACFAHICFGCMVKAFKISGTRMWHLIVHVLVTMGVVVFGVALAVTGVREVVV